MSESSTLPSGSGSASSSDSDSPPAAESHPPLAAGSGSAAGSSRPPTALVESGTAGRVTLERVTGAQVEAVSNSIAQGGNPLYKSKMAPIASIFTEFDVKYGSEFASDDAAVARVSRESLPLVFDLLPPERATAMTVDELEDAALEVWARLETPTQRLAFLWYPHADAPRRYTGADVEPPGKKPLAVWEIKRGTAEPVVRLVPVPEIYELTGAEVVDICNAASWSQAEFKAVGSWLRRAMRCGDGALRLNMLRRVQTTLLLVELVQRVDVETRDGMALTASSFIRSASSSA
ncbi:uncharacterized protein AMSG_02207 [Thecamonas trahens ATCC 50062]|uniref:Uncharacterized protein n=1 Tax=Thecamonas trahens ATCC 50062 TaxID=461836 RepID=A0A0L0DVN4_THETB|nr:hypothetical protein AMSG_02207 [Thecamonas trahens ATCC 50062]KNC56237.1 hypothetical protein AMSG_02207 [Thecamonas trahens ATCC 50062]|eukprot:XP_013760759.1 hypothetical protein AMSG_02207 [Thecamonas trahens ATCC 50062]